MEPRLSSSVIEPVAALRAPVGHMCWRSSDKLLS